MTSSQPIPVPNYLNLTNAVQCAREIGNLPEAKLYLPDFSNLTWIEPFAMLILTRAFRDLKARYPDSAIIARTPDTEPCSYARWMRFFKEAGLSKDESNAPGSETYLPLTFIPVTDIFAGASDPTTGAIDTAKKLAVQLLRQDDGPLVEAVTYSFQELLRNVVEHSESKELGYCAQYWSRGHKKNMVEIAIMDTGIGLRPSLYLNPHLAITSDRDAIMYALAPGVSGKFYAGVKADFTNPNQNSGFGLYMIYRLCNEGGSFFIGSGSAGLARKKESDNIDHETQFQGTILRLRLNAAELQDTRALLDQFRKEGDQLATSFGNGVVPTPATMSKMLREDFVALRRSIAVGDRVTHQKYKSGTIAELITLSTREPGAMVHFDSGLKKKVALDSLIPELN